VPAVAPVPAGAPPVTPGQITLSDRPELRIDPSALLSTGTLGTAANPVTGAMVYNIEAAATFGSLFAQAEYNHYTVDRRGLGTNKFDGAYIMASYTLTGEHRAYNRVTGAYGSITPAHPFSLSGGAGAWEIAARFSYADLRDGVTPGLALPANGVNGGLQQNYTFGINWYVNTYIRFMLNYVHSDIKKTQTSAGNVLAPLGAPIGYQLDAIALRTQLAW
jgi:phosphate-selective porin OprO/OprP